MAAESLFLGGESTMDLERKLRERCPEPTNNLELIATRFHQGRCYLELECRHCPAQCTAEVSMPAEEDLRLAVSRPDLPRPCWRVIGIGPADPAVYWRPAVDLKHTSGTSGAQTVKEVERTT